MMQLLVFHSVFLLRPAEEAEGDKKKKDKKKKKGEKEKEEKKKGPSKATVKAMQEALAKMKEVRCRGAGGILGVGVFRCKNLLLFFCRRRSEPRGRRRSD